MPQVFSDLDPLAAEAFGQALSLLFLWKEWVKSGINAPADQLPARLGVSSLISFMCGGDHDAVGWLENVRLREGSQIRKAG